MALNTFNPGDDLLSDEVNENFQQFLSFWSDGQDGDVTIDSSVSLDKDMNYKKLTIADGGSLDCNGYKVFAQEIDVQNGGEITLSSHSNGTLIENSKGGDGGSGSDYDGSDGKDGSNRSFSLGVNGSDGGDGGKGSSDSMTPGDGGSGGTIDPPNFIPKTLRDFLLFSDKDISEDWLPKQYQNSAGSGGGGGGSGSGNDDDSGGNGGSAGDSKGIMYIVSEKITIDGDILLNGENGNNGGNGKSAIGEGGGGGGGGAGGSAGTMILIAREIEGGGSLQLAGGNGGDGGESGNESDGGDGGNGGNGGNLYKIYKNDNSTISEDVSGGSKGVGGSGSNSNGSDGNDGNDGTITSINIDI